MEAWHAAKALDLVDESNFGQLAALQAKCYNASKVAANGPDDCKVMTDYIAQVAGNASVLDARYFRYDYSALVIPYIGYLTASSFVADLYKALHISGSTKVPIFSARNDKVYSGLKAEVNNDFTQWYDWL